ncbi:hypothetical protein HMPREF3038_03139 [Akkermansia sp. KLE1797]|nr:hypothetical protein HMPREF3038_03139 [Akkermansia sp. KLE1797]
MIYHDPLPEWNLHPRSRFFQVKSCQGRGLGAIIRKFHNRTHSHESNRHLRQPE